MTGTVSPRAVVIDGLTEKESLISDPWSQLYESMQSAADKLQWNVGGKLFQSEGFGRQLLFFVFSVYLFFSVYLSLCSLKNKHNLKTN